MSSRLAIQAQAKAGVRPFSFDQVPKEKFFSVLVSAEPDTGKTHMSVFTFPNGKVVLDTENKADLVISKLPEEDQKQIYWKRVTAFDEIRQGVEFAIRTPSIKTVVIDSGADLQDLAVKEWSEEHGGKQPIVIDKITGAVSTVLYAQVYQKIDELVRAVHNARKFLVVTGRMKDEYIDQVRTGRRIADTYKKFPWSLMITIELVKGIRDEKGKVHFEDRIFGMVTKNNFYGIDYRLQLNYKKPYLFDISYEGICNELLKPWHNGVPLGKEMEQIIKDAEDFIKQQKL